MRRLCPCRTTVAYRVGPDAIDLDVFGAFQLCSIGILTAPVTVRISTTYFNNPGRNVIFLWTAIVLAGVHLDLLCFTNVFD